MRGELESAAYDRGRRGGVLPPGGNIPRIRRKVEQIRNRVPQGRKTRPLHNRRIENAPFSTSKRRVTFAVGVNLGKRVDLRWNCDTMKPKGA